MAVLVIIVVSVGLRPPREVFLDSDEGVYAAAAMMTLDGKTMCKETYGARPGMIALYALSMAAFGYSMMAVHSVLLVFVLLTELFIFKIVRRLFDKYAGYAAALCYGIFSTTYIPNHMLGANCEIFMVLPAAISIYWVLKAYQESKVWGFFFVGFFGALGALIKAPAIVDTAGGCLFVAIPVFARYARIYVPWRGGQMSPEREPPRRPETLSWLLLAAVLTVAGIAAGIGPVLLYFWRVGALRDLYDAVWTWHSAYCGAIGARDTLLAFRWNTGTLISDNWLVWTLALAGGLALVAAPGRSERDAEPGRLPKLLLICWAVFALIGVCAGRRFWGHYYLQAYVPLSALAGTAIRAALSRWGGGRWRRPENLLLAILLFIGTAMPVAKWHRSGRDLLRCWLDLRMTKGYTAHWRECEVEREAGQYIRDNTPPTAKVFVWGIDSCIYFYARRQPATQFVSCAELVRLMCGGWVLDKLLPPQDTTLFWQRWQEEMDRSKPEIIVDASGRGLGYWFDNYPLEDFDPVRGLVAEQYEEVKTIPCVQNRFLHRDQEYDDLGKLVIYRRKPEKRPSE